MQIQQSSKNYMVLAPETPEKNPNSYGASGGFDVYQRSPITKVYESDSSVELEADLRGTKMVVGFGDNNCQIKHYYDFEADFDDFHKIISNCKFYLKKAATLLSRSIFGGADYEYIWITIIWRHWKNLNVPDTANTNWDKIVFVVWNAILNVTCRGCLYQEYYLTNFSQEIVPIWLKFCVQD